MRRGVCFSSPRQGPRFGATAAVSASAATVNHGIKLESSDAGLDALRDLCAACYAPIIALLRRRGNDADAARELAHEFFARMLEGEVNGSVAIGRAKPFARACSRATVCVGNLSNR